MILMEIEDLWYGQYLVFDFIKIQDRIDVAFARWNQ